MRYRLVPLGAACTMDRRTLSGSEKDAEALPYLGVEHVEGGSGRINFESQSRVGDGRSTTFRFDERHVLYAKLRPYLNKVAAPDFSGRCSTELIPLLPAEGVEREYLAFLLRRRATVDFVMASVTGARMPRTDMKVLMKMPVPLPPLAEQRRIVDILNRAARVERLRAQADATLRAFAPALFIKMFGDRDEIARRFPSRPLRECADIGSGATKGRKLSQDEIIEVPYLRVANVQDGHLDLREIKTIQILAREREKYALRPGDLVMTEGGDPDKLGRGAIWKGQLPYCAHQNHVFRVRPKEDFAAAEYLSELAASAYGKSYFLSVAKQTTGIASINKTQLGGFPVPLPPLEMQQQYRAILTRAEGVLGISASASTAAQDAAASLMSRLLDAA